MKATVLTNIEDEVERQKLKLLLLESATVLWLTSPVLIHVWWQLAKNVVALRSTTRIVEHKGRPVKI